MTHTHGTAQQCVDCIITEMGVFEIDDRGLTLVEIAPDVCVDDIRAATGCPVHVSDSLKPMAL